MISIDFSACPDNLQKYQLVPSFKKVKQQIQDPTKIYNEYFKSTKERIKDIDEGIPKKVLERHRIKIIPKNDAEMNDLVEHGYVYIEVKSIKDSGLSCVYEAIIGRFLLKINVLNLQRNVDFQESDSQNIHIGSGSYGFVKQVQVDGKSIAIKQIKFRQSRKKQFMVPYLIDAYDRSDIFEIRQAIRQYCLYKICSMLQIGPQLIFNDVYDLVCYNDCIQFQMELCQRIQTCKQPNYQQDLKQCVALLHCFRFVHKDIKPANVLYSPSLQKYVLTDFGITNSIKEQNWEKTPTYFQGSLDYASNQMKQLYYTKKTGYINMYLNDIHALELTIKQIKLASKLIPNSFSRNSMSFAAQESFEESYNSENNLQMDEQSDMSAGNIGSIQSSFGTSLLSTNQTQQSYIYKQSNQINFYQMKAIFQLKQVKSVQRKDILSSIQKACKNCSSPQIRQRIEYEIINIYQKDTNIQIITDFRNTIRIFGILSEEFIEKIQSLVSKQPIPYLNYPQLTNILQSVKKNMAKNTKIQRIQHKFIQIRKHQKLQNAHSRLKLCRQIIKLVTNGYKFNHGLHRKFIIQFLLLLEDGVCQDQLLSQVITCIEIYLADKPDKTQNLTLRIAHSIAKLYEQAEKFQLLDPPLIILFYILITEHKNQCSIQLAKKIEQNLRPMLQTVYCEGIDTLSERVKKILLLFEVEASDSYKCVQIGRTFKDFIVQNAADEQKIEFLDQFALHLVDLGFLEQAGSLNQMSFQIKKQFYCLDTYHGEFAKYYYLKALIEGPNSQSIPEQVIQYYELAIQNQEAISKKGQFVFTLYNNYCHFLQKLGRSDKQLQVLQNLYHQGIDNSAYHYQLLATAIDRIIYLKCLRNQSQPELIPYIQQLVNLRARAAKQKYLLNDQEGQNISLFPIKVLDAPQIKQQTSNFVKKTFILSLQPYLPMYMKTYIDCCDHLASYYINQKGQYTKALPYLWSIFQKLHKSRRDSAFYHRLNILITLLITSNSSRRALKLMKKYVYMIPEHEKELKSDIFQKIACLSHQLNANDYFFYNTLWKERAFEGYQNYCRCKSKFASISSEPIRRLYLKMLAKLQPEERTRLQSIQLQESKVANQGQVSKFQDQKITAVFNA